MRPAGRSTHSNTAISAIDQVGAATAGRMRMARTVAGGNVTAHSDRLFRRSSAPVQ